MAKATKEVKSKRVEALRQVAYQRLERLERKAQKIGAHLRKPGKAADLQSLHYLLHKVEVEYHDIARNLEKDPTWTPKPKMRREKRAIVPESGPAAPLPTTAKGEPGRPANRHIPPPVPLDSARIPEDQQSMGQGSGGRSWCSAPFVEVKLPPTQWSNVREKLLKFRIEDDADIVRRWAEAKFGSIETARDGLRASAEIGTSPDVWRSFISRAISNGKKDFEPLLSLDDDELTADATAERVVRRWHQIDWVGRMLDSILETVPSGVSKDTFRSRVESRLKTFHSSVNSFELKKRKDGTVERKRKHTNPQFPYLSPSAVSIDPDVVTMEAVELLQMQPEERFAKDPNDANGRMRLRVLQAELGKARREALGRRGEKAPPWSGRKVFRGTTTRKREACLVWDKEAQADGLYFALVMSGGPKIDDKRFVYMDGQPLQSDWQLHNGVAGKAKSCRAMPLILKHDFLRWYHRHIKNHDVNAPLEKRCVHTTTQFVFVEPDEKKGLQPRLFIRPVFKFYDPVYEVPDSHSIDKKPDCRYLIGIARGVNYPYRAAVYDCETNSIIADKFVDGRKADWERIRNELAYHQRRRDLLRNSRASSAAIQREIRAIARIRKRERGLNKVETVESIARLVDWAEENLGKCNYCFVLADLSSNLNLGRNNRVKHIAAIKEALINQMRKRGYRFKKSGKVDGVREESAWYTSAVAPSGWWAKKEEVDGAWKADKTRPLARKIGSYYCCEEIDGLHLRGVLKGLGRAKRLVLQSDDPSAPTRRRGFGSELFWDPYCTELCGHAFPQGVVLDADFIGAFNIALRPLVREELGKKAKAVDLADRHQTLNPTVALRCGVTAYEFVEVGGDPRGGLRKILLNPAEAVI
uniref:CasPi n=1 Tax=Armatimonadota bacterium TaxID=2033014 RepID=UPI0023E47A52|nr:Chain A, CasPi [Armatimonadota bacterium]